MKCCVEGWVSAVMGGLWGEVSHDALNREAFLNLNGIRQRKFYLIEFSWYYRGIDKEVRKEDDDYGDDDVKGVVERGERYVIQHGI